MFSFTASFIYQFTSECVQRLPHYRMPDSQSPLNCFRSPVDSRCAMWLCALSSSSNFWLQYQREMYTLTDNKLYLINFKDHHVQSSALDSASLLRRLCCWALWLFALLESISQSKSIIFLLILFLFDFVYIRCSARHTLNRKLEERNNETLHFACWRIDTVQTRGTLMTVLIGPFDMICSPVYDR